MQLSGCGWAERQFAARLLEDQIELIEFSRLDLAFVEQPCRVQFTGADENVVFIAVIQVRDRRFEPARPELCVRGVEHALTKREVG